jgi:hypothetical protein
MNKKMLITGIIYSIVFSIVVLCIEAHSNLTWNYWLMIGWVGSLVLNMILEYIGYKK